MAIANESGNAIPRLASFPGPTSFTMSLGRYRLLQLLHATDHGSVYEAVAPEDNEPCEVCILERNRFDGRTWAMLVKRLRLIALLDHPGSRRIREWDFDQSAPYLRDRSDEFTLFKQFESAVPLPPRPTAAIVRQLADVLAAAHQMGQAHGALSPHSLTVDSNGAIRIDLTRLDLWSDPSQPEPDSAADILGLGRVLHWLTSGREDFGEMSEVAIAGVSTQPSLAGNTAELAILAMLQTLERECLADDPITRPTARDFLERLDDALSAAGRPAQLDLTLLQADAADCSSAARTSRNARALGPVPHPGKARSRRNGNGFVPRIWAMEPLWRSRFSIPNLCNPSALKRFQKEARMMAAVRNPHTANLVEVNEQDSIHYLAMEFVAGRSLRALLDDRGKLAELDALAIVADVCRALADAHRQGIVHRDIKPENILLIDDPPGFRVKLTDFGLARQVEQSVSLNLTQDKLIGTPLYMAPEQGQAGGLIDARTDVYSLGATLFHLLAGRPPFLAETPLGVLMLHANEPPPPVRQFAADTSEGIGRIVERALAKRPSERFADAAAMLQEIERLRRGEPSLVTIHPLQPLAPPGRVREYRYRWELAANPDDLWPHVSNTERLNRAIGLPSVTFANRQDGRRIRRFGQAKKIGLVAEWEEHPFEWVEGRAFGVLREMSRGPFEWITSVVEMTPRTGGGTTLTHTFRLVPRGLVGRLVAAVEIGYKTGKALDRVYRRIDSVAIGDGSPLADHFENVAGLSGGRRRNSMTV